MPATTEPESNRVDVALQMWEEGREVRHIGARS